jgi:hypothetical protein
MNIWCRLQTQQHYQLKQYQLVSCPSIVEMSL